MPAALNFFLNFSFFFPCASGALTSRHPFPPHVGTQHRCVPCPHDLSFIQPLLAFVRGRNIGIGLLKQAVP
jgi:hypothetical protein